MSILFKGNLEEGNYTLIKTTDGWVLKGKTSYVGFNFADRPQGEWIKHEHGFWTFVNDRGERDGWLPDYECNLCGSRAWRYATNFCPNCGAKMKGADDEI